MLRELYKGKLVRLKAVDADMVGKAFPRWSQSSEYRRLQDSDPPRLFSTKATKEWVAKQLDRNGKDDFFFSIHALEDDLLLGDVGLEVVNWGSRDAFVGIGIGEPDYWGKGYGTETMQLILRYAFTELNLNRVTLNVFEYNERAVRSYEKAGNNIYDG